MASNRSRSRRQRRRYPKRSFEERYFARERNRVFVAMPFDGKDSDRLWEKIQAICTIHQLKARRADSSVLPRDILADILEEIERAEIIIVDLTGLNPNVVYELGMAHARCDSVILLAQKNQKLPFDVRQIRCVFFDPKLPEWTRKLSDDLAQVFGRLRRIDPPAVIDNACERTKALIEDLKTLAQRGKRLSGETVWFSGGLSAFAISPDEYIPPELADYHPLLLREKKSLLSLARQGCTVKVIITPPNLSSLKKVGRSRLGDRLFCLLDFLQSGDRALDSIYWAISPFRQTNIYIVGQVSYIEGFKRGDERGFQLSLRQTSPDAIAAYIDLYEALFDHMVEFTLREYGPGDQDAPMRDRLREATIKCLKKAIGRHRRPPRRKRKRK